MDYTLRLKALIISIILLNSFANAESGLCPEYCKCDIYEGRNYADCSGKRLINAFVDLSAGVEVLDLSYNDIAIIDDSCFRSFHYLINLTVTHNDIHTIYLDAFVKLRRLKSVDLGYNRLEYIDERLFEANRHLEHLNLEGNKFMSLPSGPLLRSKSLRTLNLRDCSIAHVPSDLLTALPELTELNLSQNLMITLSATPFNAPKNLKLLLLDENAWNCDKVLVKALSIMRHRGMNVSIPECDDAYNEWKQQLPVRGQTHMFERIQDLMTPATANLTNKTTEERSTALNWRNLSSENEDSDDNDNDMLDFANYIADKQTPESRLSLLDITVDKELCEGSSENLCRRYRNCLEQVSHILIKQMHPNDVKDVIYTQNDLNFAFLIGIAVGTTGVVFLITCALCLKNCLEIKKIKKENDLEAMYDTLTPSQTLLGNRSINYVQPSQGEVSIPQPPIRRPRRSRRPQARSAEHALVQRAPGSDSFISRLLGRPARHRYYRVGTTTLIRCLSRTSLFNNNNLQREASSATAGSESHPSTPVTESTPSSNERPETPPPNYGDIVGKK